jgi:tetratricopeptide (TPR) repeat protein
MWQSAFLGLMTAFAGTSHAQQSSSDSWVGKRVITRYGTVLQVGGQVVDDEGRGKNLARGKEIRDCRVYRVERVNGPWLWLVAEGSGVKGWAQAANVIPLDQAIDYITNRIRANPGGSSNYIWRANVWKIRKEYDIALADYNEAMRLDPGEALTYSNRAGIWLVKKEYDKALADCNEAIRLDPGFAHVYGNRGDAWRVKKEYDKALADYSEAIRLDPGYAWAYANRTLLELIEEKSGVMEDARQAFERFGPKGDDAFYAAFLGYLGARRKGLDQDARSFLNEAARLDPAAWPMPVVRFYRSELSQPDLMAAATDNDKQTEAHCYIGYRRVLDGDMAAAREHFAWVRDRGNPDFIEYTMSIAELDKLDRVAKK